GRGAVRLGGRRAPGPVAGKAVCPANGPGGAAVLAGAGMIVRGVWEADGGHICRRNAHDPVERRRCVDYERIGQDRFRNSDGVEFCIGPCPPSETTSDGSAANPAGAGNAGNASPAPASPATPAGGANSAGTNPGTK